MRKKHAGNVYADSMVPVATVDDIEELIAEVTYLFKKDKDIGIAIGMRLFAVLRRLQIAENQDKACQAARDFFETLERVGLHDSDAKL